MCEQLEDLNVAFDLIHFHPVYRNTLPQNARLHNIPVVETYHGMWHDDLNKHAGLLDAIITVSEGIKLNLQKRLNRLHERYYVIPNGYDSELFKNRSFTI